MEASTEVEHDIEEEDVVKDVVDKRLPAILETDLIRQHDGDIEEENSDEPGGSVRGERANFTRLVLGCIEAKFCK